jgi:hypothetical protein
MVTKSRGRHHGWWVAGALLILGIVVGGATGAAAQQQQAPLPTFEQLRWNEIQQKLGLTPDQVTALQGILAANRTALKNDFQALRAAHQALRAAWSQAEAGAISTAAKTVQGAQAQLFNDRLQGQLNILNALGPDLWKQWTALHKHHRRGGRRFGMGM